jgi:hypothetical protein
MRKKDKIGTTTECDIDESDIYFVPKSRLRREWRKWVRKSKAGAEVYSTRCCKEPVLLILLSKRDFNLFTEALDRPPRQLPESIRNAKAHYVSMAVPDEERRISIDPEKVFSQVEADRASGELADKVTTAKIRYYAADYPGFLEQFNTETGERRIGTFANGVFTPLEVEDLPTEPVGKEFGGPDCEYD